MGIKINNLTKKDLEYYKNYQEEYYKAARHNFKINQMVLIKSNRSLISYITYKIGVVVALSGLHEYLYVIEYDYHTGEYIICGYDEINLRIASDEFISDDEGIFLAFENYIIKNCFNICTREFEEGYHKYIKESNMENKKETPITDKIIEIVKNNKYKQENNQIVKNRYQVEKINIWSTYENWMNKKNDTIIIEILDRYEGASTSITINQAKELILVLGDIVKFYEDMVKFNKGDRVRVISGMFAECIGEITDIDKCTKDRNIVIKLDDNIIFNNCVCFLNENEIEVIE